MENGPRVIGESRLAEGRFLSLKRLSWIDGDGVRREWETADRARGQQAVVIVPRLRPSGRLVLIRQFRPPARRFVAEFPAGMVDEGETPEAAAARELREETGYTAREIHIGSAVYSTAGMSDEAVHMAEAEIDELAPENAHPVPNFDAAENIETLLVEPERLAEFGRREAEAGNALDAKLAFYIAGLGFRQLQSRSGPV